MMVRFNGGFKTVEPEFTGTIYLNHIRINKGGYDSSGNYWGIGNPLYSWDADKDYGHIRAHSREHAKQQLRTVYPNAKFAR